MKAIVYSRYGSPDELRLEEVPRPRPEGDQVLVEIHAGSIDAPDWRLLRSKPFLVRAHSGWLRPKYTILGCDIAGVVVAVGPRATQLRVGDEVFGDLALHGYGGFAEYVCPTERALVQKPVGVSFETAAASGMVATSALQGLRDYAHVVPGEEVLVVGASGGLGTFAVQVAKVLGAKVTAVCSTGKIELARALGADRVIDYTQEDFLAGPTRYDVIFAVNGYRPIGEYRRALAPEGRYVAAGGAWPQIREALLLGPLLSLVGRKKLGSAPARATQEDLRYVGGLLESGKLRAVIDRRYPLRQVPDAIRYVEEGHALGKVVIQVRPEPVVEAAELLPR